MSAQHSWTVAQRSNTDVVADINDEHGGLIASCDASFAPLFAAAPELLDALNAIDSIDRITDEWDGANKFDECQKIARAAIAKAKGAT